MNIVITMAGAGARFKKAGYTIPKYMIVAKEKTLFELSMMSLKGFADITSKYIFIVRREDKAIKFITEHCENLDIRKFKIIEIDFMTDGQATTAMLASKCWNYDESLLIYNIDTFVVENEMNSFQIKGDGFIPCFYGDGDHWSFVKVNKRRKAVEVREKKRISPYCSIGAYYFKSCILYEKLYNEYYIGNNVEKGEKYVSPLYNCLIKNGGDVFISIVESSKVSCLGTPKELRQFIDQP